MNEKIYHVKYTYISKDLRRETKWYLVWARKWKSGWSVDRLYLPNTVAEPIEGARFWEELPYSSCQVSGLTEEDAMKLMDEIHRTRMAHGYSVMKSGASVYEGSPSPTTYLDEEEYRPGGSNDDEVQGSNPDKQD